MPYSSHEGKAETLEFLKDKGIETALDVGPGSGTYFNLFDPYLPTIEWTCVEIWAPYVEQFRLMEKYDTIIIGDAAALDWNRFESFDVTFLGDVLEHMDQNAAERVVEHALQCSRYVVLSLPIHGYEQGTVDGNPYEAHVHQWSSETIGPLFCGATPLLEVEGDVTGTYILMGDLA